MMNAKNLKADIRLRSTALRFQTSPLGSGSTRELLHRATPESVLEEQIKQAHSGEEV